LTLVLFSTGVIGGEGRRRKTRGEREETRGDERRDEKGDGMGWDASA